MENVLKILRRSRIAPALAILMMGAPAIAQSDNCAILGSLSKIEVQMAALSPDTLPILAQALETARQKLSVDGSTPDAFDQVTNDPNWINSYLSSHHQFLSLFENGQYAQATSLRNSPPFQLLLQNKADLDSAFFCSPTALSDGQNANGQVEQQEISIEGESWIVGILRSAKSNLFRLISDNIMMMLPLIFLVSIGAFIWAMIRFDDARRNMRRRYYCNIDVTINFSYKDHQVQRSGRITDISRSGAAMTVSDEIPLAEKITVAAGIFTKDLRVVRSNGRYIGAAFLKPLREIPKTLNVSDERKFVPRREYQTRLEDEHKAHLAEVERRNSEFGTIDLRRSAPQKSKP